MDDQDLRVLRKQLSGLETELKSIKDMLSQALYLLKHLMEAEEKRSGPR